MNSRVFGLATTGAGRRGDPAGLEIGDLRDQLPGDGCALLWRCDEYVVISTHTVRIIRPSTGSSSAASMSHARGWGQPLAQQKVPRMRLKSKATCTMTPLVTVKWVSA